MLAFRGAGGERLLGASPCGVSPVPLLPQESRTFRYSQPKTVFVQETILKKQQSFEKSLYFKFR
jgi:hypothetical protein